MPGDNAWNDRLIARMRAGGALRSARIEQAFRRVSRRHFLPHLPPEEAFRDEAIATHREEGNDKWISSSSQPTMMAIMLEQLNVQPGMRVLEIGAGTGYNAALLAELTGNPELVWTVDMTEDFCAEARAHLAAAGKDGVHVVCADGWHGWPEAAPYDRVIVTASAYDIAPAWSENLRTGGILAVPWGSSAAGQYALSLQKQGNCLVQQSSHSCGFMPLRGEFALTMTEPPVENADAWEHPWTAPLPEDFTPSPDLAFFVSLFTWPLQAIVFWRDEMDDQAGWLGLLQGAQRLVASVEHLGEHRNGWKTVGQGAAASEIDLEAYVHLWLRWGRPTLDQLGLRAYLKGSAPEPNGDQALARREWFDYLVSPLL